MRIININQNLFHTNMANNQQELQRLLNIIPVGRANAMHAEDIARGMWYPTGGNQVETRELIRYAIQQGYIIVSTPRDGYWRSNIKQEVIDCTNSLINRADEIYDRCGKAMRL